MPLQITPTIVELAAVVGGFATAFAAVFGMIVIPIAVVQIKSARRLQRETAAFAAYDGLLRMFMNHPEFAEPNKYGMPAEFRSDGGPNPTYTQYEWFVSSMLAVFDALLSHHGEGRRWVGTISRQLDRHRDYLSRAVWLKQVATERYGARLRALLQPFTSTST
jgi:hypothetical protein